MPNANWDGRERRRATSDHDALIRIITLLENHTKSFEDHIMADNLYFKEIKNEIKAINRFMWTVIGGMVLLNALPAASNFMKLLQ